MARTDGLQTLGDCACGGRGQYSVSKTTYLYRTFDTKPHREMIFS